MAASFDKAILSGMLVTVNEHFSNFLQTLDSLESESEEELDIAKALVQAQVEAEETEQGRNRLKRDEHIEEFLELADNQFQAQFRISRASFQMLLEILAPQFKHEKKKGRPIMSLKKQLMIVVWLLTHKEGFRSIASRFHVANSCIGKCFLRIITALVDVSSYIVVWPTDSEVPATTNGFRTIGGLPNTIGVIDSMHVAIRVPKSDVQSYMNCSGYPSIVLQAVCDSKMKFTDCFCGYPGNVPDNQILKNSVLYQNILKHRDDYFPNNSHIVGDSSYPLHGWLVTPIAAERGLMAEEKAFNRMANVTSSISRRAFVLLKRRFCRLRRLDVGREGLFPRCIVAACVIHNVCLLSKEDVSEYLVDWEEDEVCVKRVRDSIWTPEHTALGIEKRASLVNDIAQDV